MSIKELIIKHLEDNYGNSFCWGGVLARAIHDQTGTKESVVERRARELVKSGILEAVYDQIDGKGAKCVRWRIKPAPYEWPPLPEEFLKTRKIFGIINDEIKKQEQLI